MKKKRTRARQRFLRVRGGNVSKNKNNDRACVSTSHATIPRCNQLSAQLA
jgi:hypothetical protein